MEDNSNNSDNSDGSRTPNGNNSEGSGGYFHAIEAIKAIKAIEGDFLETKDHLIFDVKGLIHPEDRIIAFLRYIPVRFFFENIKIEYVSALGPKNLDQFKHFKNNLRFYVMNGNLNEILSELNSIFDFEIEDIRVRKIKDDNKEMLDRIYLKIYDINSRYKVLEYIKPNYIFHHKNYDFPLQAVPISDILKIHKPEESMQKILASKKLSTHYVETLEKLQRLFSEVADVSKENIGISGSVMVDLYAKTSDYDLVIYGKEESLRVRNLLRRIIFANYNIEPVVKELTIKKYNEQELRQHFKFRGKGFNFKLEDFIRTESRKLHQFFANGIEVFVRFMEKTRNDSYENDSFEKSKFETLGRISLIGLITDASQSFFTPAIYSVKPIEITEFSTDKTKSSDRIPKIGELNKLETIEIFTLRGRFMEQAIAGEKVDISGKLERVTLFQDISVDDFKIERQYLRIILGVDKKDHCF